MTEFLTNIEGHVYIHDPESGEVLLDTKNAIHFENASIALAKSLAHRPDGHIYEMVFGNGAATVTGIGTVTYLTPNIVGTDENLYRETYAKIIDDQSPLNEDPLRNKLEVRHTNLTVYTDIICTCTLDYGEPDGQEAFDDASSASGEYIFNELGLKTSGDILISHVIFHPIQKSLNRVIEVIYTLRISMC